MSEPYIAEIKIISWNFAPRNWAFCNGQLLPINQNQALFSILGTTYGGNGQTTFALPNLQGRAPVHSGQGVSLGQSAGETAHTVTMSEMPAHNHVPQGGNVAANVGPVANAFWADSGKSIFAATPNSQMLPAAVSNVGGSQPHNNMQPYLVLNFVIALVGIFPSRN